MTTVARGLVALVFAAPLLLAACATIGETFDTVHLREIRTGAQDRAQIRAWFGEPHQRTAPLPHESETCTERWLWAQAAATPGGTAASNVLVIDFDADGRVCAHTYSRTR